MMIDFDGYQCFDPGVDRPLSEVTKTEAKKHFDLLMREKDARIAELRKLVQRSGIELNGSDDSIQKLNDWLFLHVEQSEKELGRLKPIWYSVVNDIALFLGEEIIRRARNPRWELLLSGKKNLSFQRPVITGFSKVTNPKYNIDLDWTIGVYGHRIISKNEEERDLFVRIVKSAIQNA
jgi:hypothetical protein